MGSGCSATRVTPSEIAIDHSVSADASPYRHRRCRTVTGCSPSTDWHHLDERVTWIGPCIRSRPGPPPQVCRHVGERPLTLDIVTGNDSHGRLVARSSRMFRPGVQALQTPTGRAGYRPRTKPTRVWRTETSIPHYGSTHSIALFALVVLPIAAVQHSGERLRRPVGSENGGAAP